MWYPPSMHPAAGDPYSTTVEGTSVGGKVSSYLNATPRQSDETLENWPSFRVEHLREESASTVTVLSRASGLSFRGGRGTCLIDEYVTKVKSNRYREIACYVVGMRSSAAVIAAAPASGWSGVAQELEQAVSSFQPR